MPLTSSETALASRGAVAEDHLADGKMQLWRRASMFLEDASSLNRGSTFSTICQGYLRWGKTMELSQPRR